MAEEQVLPPPPSIEEMDNFNQSFDLESLENHNNTLSTNHLGRKSLFRQFDPLVDATNANNTNRIEFEFKTPGKPLDKTTANNQTIYETPSGGNNGGDVSNASLIKWGTPSGTPVTNNLNHQTPPTVNGNHCVLDCTITPMTAAEHANKETNGYSDVDSLAGSSPVSDMQVNGIKSPESPEIDATALELQKLIIAQTAIIRELAEGATQLIEQRESELGDAFNKLQEAERERDNALKDIANIENSFAELHGRYEKLKVALEGSKGNEDELRDRLEHTEDQLCHERAKYDALKAKASEAIDRFLYITFL